MKYKYIGTNEQLVKFDYEVRDDGLYPFAISNQGFDVEADDGDMIDNIVIDLHIGGDIYWNMWELHHTDITPFIQDLIEAGLVEVIK